MAVELAFYKGWRSIWLEVDSSYVVQLFLSCAQVPWRIKGRWMRVLGYIQQMDFRVTHIYREGNQVADFLASSAMEDGWWPFAHPKIVQLVNKDFFSHSYYRVAR